jgi:hypothetical protein
MPEISIGLVTNPQIERKQELHADDVKRTERPLQIK